MSAHLLLWDPPAPLSIMFQFLGQFCQIWWRPQRHCAPGSGTKIQARVEETNPPCSLTQEQARTTEEPDQCAFLRQNSLKLELTVSALQGIIWLIWWFKRRGEHQPCSRDCLLVLDVQFPARLDLAQVTACMCFGKAELITVTELSCSPTDFYKMVLQGVETSSITMNFSNRITAHQKCEERHFLWVSGAQPTCWVQTSICLSEWEEQRTLQVLQHVQAAETPIKC